VSVPAKAEKISKEDAIFLVLKPGLVFQISLLVPVRALAHRLTVASFQDLHRPF